MGRAAGALVKCADSWQGGAEFLADSGGFLNRGQSSGSSEGQSGEIKESR